MELGAGFDPMLSGRENLYFKGNIMGLTKEEIDERLDEIIEFADIGDYMEMPLNNYSSGMRARLGFALAINVDPDILIINKVFAVGDRDFQKKSKIKTMEFFEKRKTVLFVSHSESLIKEFCTRVIYLQDGFVNYDGPVDEGIEFYHNSLKEKSSSQAMILKKSSYVNGVVELTFEIGYMYQNSIFKPIDLEELEIHVNKFSKERNFTDDINFANSHYDIIDETTIKVYINDRDILNAGDITLGFVETKSNKKGTSYSFLEIDMLTCNNNELNVEKHGGMLLLALMGEDWRSEE